MPKSPDEPMEWTETQEKALALAFEGRWTNVEIARKCHVSLRTYGYWHAHPAFTARLEALRADFAAIVRDVTYTDKARRLLALNQMAEAARRDFERKHWLKETRPTKDGPITNESWNQAPYAEARAALADIAAELGARKNAPLETDAAHIRITIETDTAPAGVAARSEHDTERAPERDTESEIEPADADLHTGR